MKSTRTLHSFSANTIQNVSWDRPEMTDDQIECKPIFVGVCRSDIGSYTREENMPYTDDQNPNGKLGGFGHEGLAEVTRVGKNIKNVEVGDFVATWSDPAYSDLYYAKQNEFTVVPEASPKYILQPVACAINIITKLLNQRDKNNIDKNEPILLLGSGFMSIVIGQYCKYMHIPLIVVGKSNEEIWNDLGYGLYSLTSENYTMPKYKLIIDLTSRAETFNKIVNELAEPEAIICYASTPSRPVTTNFFEACWNCLTFILPSPRNSDFHKIMDYTCTLIQAKVLDTEKLWSKGYNRDNDVEVKQAFEDGKTRPNKYLRGYLEYGYE